MLPRANYRLGIERHEADGKGQLATTIYALLTILFVTTFFCAVYRVLFQSLTLLYLPQHLGPLLEAWATFS